MILRGCLVFIFLFHFFFSRSAGEYTVVGGRAAGMGFTSVTAADGWSGFNNEAGLAWCKQFGAGIHYENRFLVKELSLKALAVTLPAGSGCFGVTFRHFGFSLYSEMNAGIAYGLRIGKNFSIGVRAGGLRIHVADGFRDQNLFTAEAGVQFRASESLWLGLHAVNPVPYRISQQTAERLPTVIGFGLRWILTKNLISEFEIEKDLCRKPVLKAGIEYKPVNAISLRTGYNSDPSLFTFGAGIEMGNLQFDLASSYHLILGFSPQASLLYHFGRHGKPKEIR